MPETTPPAPATPATPDPKPAKKEGGSVSANDIAEALYQEINQVRGAEYWLVRINKKSALKIGGLLLALMWLIPLGQSVYSKYGNEVRNRIQAITTKQQPQAPAKPVNKVLLRKVSGSDEAINTLKQQLEASVVTSIDVADDPDTKIKGIGVVVKPGNEAMQSLLKDQLSGYEIASTAAELTQDSQYDALLLVGL